MQLLPDIRSLDDLRRLNRSELPKLAEELVSFMRSNTRSKDGHLASSEGVAGLTVALHYVFDTPNDILIWDVGHQAYIHKILTDRKERFSSNRKRNGISGFPSRNESSFDPFGTGHSSTSISALAGFSSSGELKGLKRKYVAVIGDGALTGGMAFEALNHLGTTGQDVLIILNDNGVSIDDNVGALSEQGSYETFFKSLGFTYSEDLDQLDASEMVQRLEVLREQSGPRVWRVGTKRAELKGSSSDKLTWQEVVGNTLVEMAKANDKLVVVTPAMTSGSGLQEFSKKFPERFFDVGIAEQHAVTFSAGLAADGMQPICILYSTFAQRAYDQIIHDVALQKLHVTFLLDRAGLVGEDGPTHHGAFDMSFLLPIPNLRIQTPANSLDLVSCIKDSLDQSGPSVIRYPKGAIHQEPIKINSPGDDLAILAVGPMYYSAIEAVSSITDLDISVHRVMNVKPLDQPLMREVCLISRNILVIEDGSLKGGVFSEVLQFTNHQGYKHRVEGLGLPDTFVPHGSNEELFEYLHLDAGGIARKIREML